MVFDHNELAMALYAKHGYVSVGIAGFSDIKGFTHGLARVKTLFKNQSLRHSLALRTKCRYHV